MCIPLHVSGSYICVHVSLSSAPALWHLGLLFPGAGSWSIPLEVFPQPSCFPCRQHVRHPPLFPFLSFFLTPVFQSPRCFPQPSIGGAVLPPGVTIRQAGKGASCFSGKVFFCCPLGPKKKSKSTQKGSTATFLPSPIELELLPGKGFFWMSWP